MSKNPLPGNPHLQAADNAELPHEPFAIAQATLALAYEQRTANLIAAYNRLSDGSVCLLDQIVDEAAIANQIKERLGL